MKPIKTPDTEQTTREHPYFASLRDIQRRAREHIEQGALTADYGGDVKVAIELLNEALATEIVCTLRYRQNSVVAEGMQAKAVADEFMEHAREEQDHADRIAVRIRQLGGTPDFAPQTLLTRSHADYVAGGTLDEMIRENLIAERIAIESYREMVRYFGDNDSTSRRMMEEILAKEEEHADELATFIHMPEARHARLTG